MKVEFDSGCAWANWMLIPTINVFVMDGVAISFWFLCFYVTVEIWKE